MKNNLAERPIEELREMAAKLNLQMHHKCGPAKLAEAITAKLMDKPIDTMKHTAEQPAPVVHSNTQEDVSAALQPYVAKGMVLTFPGDGTMIMKCKGAEESVNLSIPLRVIKMKAGSVVQGARKPRSLGKDLMNGTYADEILM